MKFRLVFFLMGVAVYIELHSVSTAQTLTWDKDYNFPGLDHGYFTRMLPLSNGDLLLAGYGEHDWYGFSTGFMRIDTNGSKLWDRSYSFSDSWQQMTKTLVQKPGSDVFYSFSFNPNIPIPIKMIGASQDELNDCWLLKFTSGGDTLSKTHCTDIGWVNDLILDGDKLVAAGATNYENQIEPGYLSKATILVMDTSGNVTLSKEFFEDDNAVVNSIIKKDDGDFYIVGSILNYFDLGQYDPDRMFVMELDPSLNVVWTYESDYQWSEGSRIIHCMESNYVIIGDGFTPSGSDRDIIIWRLQNDNSIYIQDYYDISNSDYANDIRQTDDGGFIFCGSVTVQSSDKAFFYMKIGQEGNEEWHWNDAGNYHEAMAVMINGNSGYYIAGHGNGAKLVKTDLLGNGLIEAIDSPQPPVSVGLLKVYPNPARGYMIVSYCLNNENRDNYIDILDVTSNKVGEVKLQDKQNRVVIPVSRLKVGCYLLRLISGQRVIETHKLIVL
jgi:hypothetical protein